MLLNWLLAQQQKDLKQKRIAIDGYKAQIIIHYNNNNNNNDHVLLDFQIQTHKLIEHNKPDILVLNIERSCLNDLCGIQL